MGFNMAISFNMVISLLLLNYQFIIINRGLKMNYVPDLWSHLADSCSPSWLIHSAPGTLRTVIAAWRLQWSSFCIPSGRHQVLRRGRPPSVSIQRRSCRRISVSSPWQMPLRWPKVIKKIRLVLSSALTSTE